MATGASVKRRAVSAPYGIGGSPVPWCDGREVLLVEDDETIGRSLAQALESQGYDVRLAVDGAAARAAFALSVPDLVVLDLGLPDVDGVDLCRELGTAVPALPIMVLTARHEEADIVVSLDAGAVDYVTKPFRLAELLARVRAHLRGAEPSDAELTVVGDLRIDHGASGLGGGAGADAPAAGVRPARAAGAEAGRVVTRERIMDEVWDEHWHGSTKTLDVHISALRRKLVERAGQGVPGHHRAAAGGLPARRTVKRRIIVSIVG